VGVAGSIRYTEHAGAFIAYEVLGAGPRDLLVVMDGFISIDMLDDEPRVARCTRRLNSFARLIRFDRRGVGLSDPVSPATPPTLEQWAQDAIAVLDAAHSARAVVLASAEVSPLAMLLAATYPDRVESLVVVNAFARALVDDDYPDGFTEEQVAEILQSMTDPSPPSEAEDFVQVAAPSVAHDPQFREWWAAAGQRGASPATARAISRAELENDVRPVLPTIHVPTLVVHLRGDVLVPMAVGRYVADRIAGSRWVEVDAADDMWWVSDHADEVLDEIEEFVTGARPVPPTNRVLASIMFTDIVSSTERANELGDRRWRDFLDQHDAAVRRQLERHHGTEVNTTGDGFVARFDGPARAVGCAVAIRDVARQLGIRVRTGVHTGEIELRGDDIAGIAVHIAARVAALAEPDCIWVSRTVTELVIGSGLRFDERGGHELKGVPGTWPLYAVVDS
jgi:class 3 adenylate cyclase